MTKLVNERIDFREDALLEYMKTELNLQGGHLEIERISGGQSNPTYFVSYGGRRLVLRKKPAGPILPGAHAVEREFRVLKALRQTDVPVPEVFSLCENADVLGTPFYLMERLEGRVFADCALPDFPASERKEIYFALAETMARLHAVNPEEIGLGDFGRPGNYFERQIVRWSRQYAASTGTRIPALDELASWLPDHLPPDDGRSAIAHGDFRLGNMIFHPQKTEVIGILDWELSTLGHPLADLAFCCIPWRSSSDEYGGILGVNFEALGIPSETAFVERYFQNAIPTAPLRPFHVVFALFRFAIIFVGIADRARTGNASAENADEVGMLAGRFAERALQCLKQDESS